VIALLDARGDERDESVPNKMSAPRFGTTSNLLKVLSEVAGQVAFPTPISTAKTDLASAAACGNSTWSRSLFNPPSFCTGEDGRLAGGTSAGGLKVVIYGVGVPAVKNTIPELRSQIRAKDAGDGLKVG
jgi:hypothetical protein